MDILLLPPSLFEDTVQRSRWQIVARFACNSHSARLDGMLKLSMTPLCSNQVPAILSQSIENLADFHKASIPQ